MTVRCPRCGTDDQRLQYRSGKMKNVCYDCQNHHNITTTSAYKRFDAKDLNQVDRESFVTWKRGKVRKCHYCGITDQNGEIYALDVVNNRNGVRHEAVNVDRIDSDRPYVLENLVLSCGLCNQIKSSNLTEEDMLQLGPILLDILRRHRREAYCCWMCNP